MNFYCKNLIIDYFIGIIAEEKIMSFVSRCLAKIMSKIIAFNLDRYVKKYKAVFDELATK